MNYKDDSNTSENIVKTSQNHFAANISILDGMFFDKFSKRVTCCLNAITGLSRILSEEQLNSEQKQYASDIDHASRSVLSMLNDATTLWGIESGQIEIITEEFSLEDLFSEICAILQPQAAKKCLEFAIMYSSPIPANIRGDRQLLRRCLVDLGGCAIDSTNTGYVHIDVRIEKNDCTKHIRFDIIDCSGMISGNTQEPFCLYDQTGTVLFEWKELKLAAASHLIEAMEGKLIKSINQDRGSVFSLIIPTGDTTDGKLLNRDRQAEIFNSQIG